MVFHLNGYFANTGNEMVSRKKRKKFRASEFVKNKGETIIGNGHFSSNNQAEELDHLMDISTFKSSFKNAFLASPSKSSELNDLSGKSDYSYNGDNNVQQTGQKSKTFKEAKPNNSQECEESDNFFHGISPEKLLIPDDQTNPKKKEISELPENSNWYNGFSGSNKSNSDMSTSKKHNSKKKKEFKLFDNNLLKSNSSQSIKVEEALLGNTRFSSDWEHPCSSNGITKRKKKKKKPNESLIDNGNINNTVESEITTTKRKKKKKRRKTVVLPDTNTSNSNWDSKTSSTDCDFSLNSDEVKKKKKHHEDSTSTYGLDNVININEFRPKTAGYMEIKKEKRKRKETSNDTSNYSIQIETIRTKSTKEECTNTDLTISPRKHVKVKRERDASVTDKSFEEKETFHSDHHTSCKEAGKEQERIEQEKVDTSDSKKGEGKDKSNSGENSTKNLHNNSILNYFSKIETNAKVNQSGNVDRTFNSDKTVKESRKRKTSSLDSDKDVESKKNRKDSSVDENKENHNRKKDKTDRIFHSTPVAGKRWRVLFSDDEDDELEEVIDNSFKEKRHQSKKNTQKVSERIIQLEEASDEKFKTIVEKLSSRKNDQKFDLTDLIIANNFDIPPLHFIETRISARPTQQQTEKIQRKGLDVKEQTFYTAKEDEILKRNWEKFCEEYDIPKDGAPALMNTFSDRKAVRLETKLMIVRYLGQGLPDRLLHSIYRRFKNLFKPIVRGRYTEDEDVVLCKMVKEESRPDTFAVASRILNRNKKDVHKRYDTLKKKSVKWTMPLMQKLVSAILDATEVINVSKLNRREISDEEWEKVSDKLDIPATDLKLKWDRISYQFFVDPSMTVSEVHEKIVRILEDMKLDDWRAINWKEVASNFDGFSPRKIRELFHYLVSNKVPEAQRKNLTDVINHLNNFYFPLDVNPLYFKCLTYKNGILKSQKRSKHERCET